MSGHRNWSEFRAEQLLIRLRETVVIEINGSDPGHVVKESVLSLIDRRLDQIRAAAEKVVQPPE